ncbi:NTP pyrophosphatase (non-canonical NTP hydrolase) [Actinophytocola algeriensis]|uniref:NTP pyrophosphatase (Non-canonical NTP hydrolase) n=1 Tax=Actinophytocola algeriensis TaxID=1768010 RepID=A0A7W7VI48_9PSEU|nr:NTP pyrophosphatase (non-canonical NTP hydrolase) [Actinophytocola algeriensis]MBE1479040.1 NTP pyrophosphatase (non-canonical NTP hydrolase) [Actinophytocola algeriensis]
MTTERQAERVREEVADVFAYLLQLADHLDIDLAGALREKVRRNEQRYPVALAKGRADKYDQIHADET